MAPRKEVKVVEALPKRKRKMPPKNSEEYVEKREKNNIAVKKCRDKGKKKASFTIDMITQLKDSNSLLEQQVTILSKELSVLKDLFTMVHDGESTCPVTPEDSDSPNNTSTDTDSERTVLMKKITEEVKQTAKRKTFVNKEAVLKDHEYISTKY